MQNTLQNIGVTALWHGLEEISSYYVAPVSDARRFQYRLCLGHNIRLIKQDSTHGPVCRKNTGKCSTLTPAYVHDTAKSRQIVCRCDSLREALGVAGHTAIEERCFFRVLSEVFPQTDAMNITIGVFP